MSSDTTSGQAATLECCGILHQYRPDVRKLYRLCCKQCRSCGKTFAP